MKKAILFVLALVNFGLGSFFSNAQTEVLEFTMADDWQFERGKLYHGLCVLNGNYGKLQFLHYDGDKCMFDAYCSKDSNSNVTIKLTNPSQDWPTGSICFSKTSSDYYVTEHGGMIEIREKNLIPKSEWNSKMAQYGISNNDICSSGNSSSNSSSYNSSSDGSVIGAVVVGAVILGAIFDAVSSSSSSSSSSSNNKSGPEVGRRSYKNVEIVDVKYNDGNLLRCVAADVRVRNKNSYSVVVKVQCRFDVAKWDEGRYIEEVTVPAGGIRTVEISGPQRCSYYDTRILSVY